MKFAWIQKHRDSYPVAAMCRVLVVSKSGFMLGPNGRPAHVLSERRRSANRSVVFTSIPTEFMAVKRSLKSWPTMTSLKQLAATRLPRRCVKWA